MEPIVDVGVYGRNPSGYDTFQSFFLSSVDAPAAKLYGRMFEELALGERQRVLEIGVGTGLNLARYPEGVELSGVDLSEEMLELAQARAAELGRSVSLVQGDGANLAFPDESFDRVVCTFVVCSCNAPREVLREALRVCRSGGRLALFDYHHANSNPHLIADQHFMRETMLAGIVFAGQRVAVCDSLYELEPNLPDSRGWESTFDERLHHSLAASFRATVLTKE